MNKFMRITFNEDGTVWDVPAQAIANNRTEYYAEQDGFKEGSIEWVEEMDFVLNDENELCDWASNNMNWEDIEPYAERASTPPKKPNYKEWWTNANKQVVVHKVKG